MSTIKSSTDHLTLNADGASKDIKFQANGVEKAVIDSAGNVGIGTSSPSEKLDTPNIVIGGSTISGSYRANSILMDNNAGTARVYSTGPDATTKGSYTFNNASSDGRLNSEAMRIDSSGNVGLGVTPEAWRSNMVAIQLGYATSLYTYDATPQFFLANNSYLDSSGNEKRIVIGVSSSYEQTSTGTHVFKVSPTASADSVISFTTAMTIDNSGDKHFGGTFSSNTKTARIRQSDALLSFGDSGTASQDRINFSNGNGAVGSINTSGSATAYNTSSDYRLKENVVPMTGSIDRLKALKPSRFNFIADADTTVDGFLAHEAQEVVPEAITGTKDAMTTEEYEVTPAIEEVKDEEGNITTEAVEAVMGEREVPDMQGIDQSKLVPLLVASLQEAVARIEVLEAQLKA